MFSNYLAGDCAYFGFCPAVLAIKWSRRRTSAKSRTGKMGASNVMNGAPRSGLANPVAVFISGRGVVFGLQN